MASVFTRFMIRRDMRDVYRIENASFDQPWSDDDFTTTLRQRNTIGRVAILPNGQIVGFVIYELHHNLIQLIDIAVDPVYRRCGIGSEMVNVLIGRLSTTRRYRLLALVGEHNLLGHQFFRSQKMRVNQIIGKHFADGTDAYRFEYSLIEPNRSSAPVVLQEAWHHEA